MLLNSWRKCDFGVDFSFPIVHGAYWIGVRGGHQPLPTLPFTLFIGAAHGETSQNRLTCSLTGCCVPVGVMRFHFDKAHLAIHHFTVIKGRDVMKRIIISLAIGFNRSSLTSFVVRIAFHDTLASSITFGRLSIL